MPKGGVAREKPGAKSRNSRITQQTGEGAQGASRFETEKAPAQIAGKEQRKRMPEIPVQQFRGMDRLYDEYVRNPTGEELSTVEDSSDLEVSTEGYLVQIPFAPGSEPCTGPSDPKYRKIKQEDVTLADLQTPGRHPIIIFNSPDDLQKFLQRFPLLRVSEEKLPLLYKEIEHVVEKGGDCRLMPDGSFVMYLKEIDEMLATRRELGGKISTSHIKLSTLCYYLLLLIVISTVIIGVLAFAMNRLFPTLFQFGSSSSVSLSPDEKMRASYKILKLPSGASVDEVKKQYRKLAVKWHPDRNPNCVDCEAKFMVIADAYKTILDIMDGGDGEPTQQREGSDPDREFIVRPMRYR